MKQEPGSVDLETTGGPPKPTPAAVATKQPSALKWSMHAGSSSRNISLAGAQVIELAWVMH